MESGELDCLPDIICSCSAARIVSGVTPQDEGDRELTPDMSDDTFVSVVFHSALSLPFYLAIYFLKEPLHATLCLWGVLAQVGDPLPLGA
jgi:hypothetical protein